MTTELPRRIIVVSPDQELRPQLATALAATGAAIDIHMTVDSLATDVPPALCVIHLDAEQATAASEIVARLTGTCPVIAMVPKGSLATVVDLMQSSDRVAATIVAEDGGVRQLVAVATRILAGDLFGLDKLMAPGTAIQTQVVGNHREKSLCMAAVDAFVETHGVSRKYREPIQQCLDEMLMNALYDAPTDADGVHIFAGVPTRTRIMERTAQTVAVHYAFDGARFAISVRDSFGSLDRAGVLRHLHKGLHATEAVDRKAGGAGLGLYLMANSSTAVLFHVLPKIATEAICVFDVERPKLELEQLGFLVQSDAGGRTPVGPARRMLASQRKRILRVVAMLAAAALVVGGIVVVPRMLAPRPPPVPDAPMPVPTVELDSEPTGATVEIDGALIGTTPVTVTTLVPGATVSITFSRLGYQSATAPMQVPERGDVKRLVQPLALSADYVRVRFVSKPAGAEVVQDGQVPGVDRTYTPAEIFVKADTVQRFTLTMPKHQPLVLEPFTPARGTEVLEKGGDLVPLQP